MAKAKSGGRGNRSRRPTGGQASLATTCRDAVLAFDLGATSGWAYFVDGKLVDHEAFKLTPKHATLRKDADTLRAIIKLHEPDVIVYEDVEFAQYRMSFAYHVSRATLLKLIGEEMGIPVFGLPVKNVKRIFTGNGNANKALIIEKVKERYGVDLTEGKGDDVADAIACGFTALAD